MSEIRDDAVLTRMKNNWKEELVDTMGSEEDKVVSQARLILKNKVDREENGVEFLFPINVN